MTQVVIPSSILSLFCRKVSHLYFTNYHKTYPGHPSFSSLMYCEGSSSSPQTNSKKSLRTSYPFSRGLVPSPFTLSSNIPNLILVSYSTNSLVYLTELTVFLLVTGGLFFCFPENFLRTQYQSPFCEFPLLTVLYCSSPTETRKSTTVQIE